MSKTQKPYAAFPLCETTSALRDVMVEKIITVSQPIGAKGGGYGEQKAAQPLGTPWVNRQ